MPFIGVRISWLTLARNSVFASLARTAWARASSSAAPCCSSRDFTWVSSSTCRASSAWFRRISASARSRSVTSV
jgi:hypothetical protein